MPNSPADSTWIVFPRPASAPGGIPKFNGMQTEVDASFGANAPGSELAFVAGQNVFDYNGDKFGTRPYGLSLITGGTPSVAAGGYRSNWTFHRRDGVQIPVGARGTVLEIYDETSNAFATLQSGRASDDYGFAEFNVNANAESRLYFGNGVDSFAYWNGGLTNLNGALVGAEATIPVTSTSTFSATGSIIIGGTTVTYTGITATSFTGCAGTPAAATGLAVLQAVTEDGAAPKGNIYMSANNRLFMAGVTANPQLVLFSAYGNSASWSTTTVLSSTATSAGAFNLIEGGGSVTGMVQDETSLYFLKQSMVYAATLTDALYTLVALKPFDGRSKAVGSIGKRGVFVGGNIVFVITPDNKIQALQRMQTIDYPQVKPLSYMIQPTCDAFDFSTATGIVFKDYAWFACKSSPDAAVNDRVLPYNIIEDHWEAPIVGWNVGEWFIYDDGDGAALFFGDAVSPNVWRLDASAITDGENIVTSYRTTKQYDLGTLVQGVGSQAELKELEAIFIEGYISPSTALTIELLLDEDGYSGAFETTFLGTETAYIVGSQTINAFGLVPFGTLPFGSNPDLTGVRKFRLYLDKNFRRVPFFLCQLRFSTSGANQRYFVTRYGFKVRAHSQPIKRSLSRQFS
jgi:hypothetical protein